MAWNANADQPDGIAAGTDSGHNAVLFRSINDQIRFKRNPNPVKTAAYEEEQEDKDRSRVTAASDRQWRAGRSHHHGRSSSSRRFLLFPCRGRSMFYFCIFFAVFSFALASMVLQSSIASVFRAGTETGKTVRQGLKYGSSLRFVQERFSRQLSQDLLRNEPRSGLRPPRLGLVLGNMKEDPSALLLFTVMKNLQRLGYMVKIFAVEDGKARSFWEKIGGRISIIPHEGEHNIDWSMFQGIIADSIEVKDVISSLMQEPFCSIPLIWTIHEDALANRLLVYKERGWEHLVSYWKNTFSRADVVVFPDYSLPMLYSELDTGNFFVIPGSPIDFWVSESYSKTHSKIHLRKEYGFSEDDMLVLVIGSAFFYNELSWDYAVALHDIGPLLIKYAREKDSGDAFKFIFLCGNSSGEYVYDLQELTSHLGIPRGSVRHYGFSDDVNGLLMMSDIVLYGSSQDEQGFPSLVLRALSYGVPVVAPDYPNIKKYVFNGVHGLVYPKHDAEALKKAFSRLISNGKLSKFAHSVASSGKLLARNMQALDYIATFAKLLEDTLTYPSYIRLPSQISQLKGVGWEWNFFSMEMEQSLGSNGTWDENSTNMKNANYIYQIEEELNRLIGNSASLNETDIANDFPTELDWSILTEIETMDEVERLEREEIEGRMEKDSGVWDDIYRNARKSEKIRFESNERDEGELERTGQPLSIYEIYDGEGAWPFLHHGSLYRGLSLSTRTRRLRSDDIDAVGRLPILNNSYYKDILCEMGGMFAMANSVDNIHKRPWIGFQSWHAAGKKASLSPKAEQVLGELIQKESKGDVIYFWSQLDMASGLPGNNGVTSFWSMCDILNGGNCRTTFGDAFRRMYGLSLYVDTLPPMPEDGDQWSSLHSWVMPTPSFLEFIMFSRMFADSLNELHNNNSSEISHCILGSSNIERKHCYCRILEVLVNVWAYHSGRKMVYIEPHSGILKEQHAIEKRKGQMWTKFFNLTLLKSMDEDLAEAADDNDYPSSSSSSSSSSMWLWPLTGEVYWQGIYEREREERYRLKMDKKRKTREKLFERMKYGYRQKSLGRR
ncbi:uncharacterized protein LOC124920798 [Impatiens glandulifera]|uniref:uncharacterized protein LOC124920798 n=1 Tax=Impatiens glandulifera TaxID=253017 RepID=UPI001FB0F83B|nr:uncharacterized protein LOC124920798 [Impatiens glandulifera]